MASGPLNGIKIVEFAGIGPGPFCGMLLSDLGADVIRIDRPGRPRPANPADITARGRRSIRLNLKQAGDLETALKLIEKADGLIEGYRPGVMERNGLGPDQVLKRNPQLVYGRMTGWGQHGGLSQAAGHDLNYIAITGALHAMGDRNGRPRPPLNLIGDYGGGALYLAMGMLAGILNVRQGGEGQVIDCAMSDGAASLTSMFYGMRAMGLWHDEREANLLDGGAHFYDTYACADGKWISIGAIEPQFYALLIEKAGLTDPEFAHQMDREKWPELKQKLSQIIQTRTREEWCRIMEGTDICFAPVLSMAEAPSYPHNQDRQTFIEIDNVVQPAPAPRFSKTPGSVQGPPSAPGADTDAILEDWNIA